MYLDLCLLLSRRYRPATAPVLCGASETHMDEVHFGSVYRVLRRKYRSDPQLFQPLTVDVAEHHITEQEGGVT